MNIVEQVNLERAVKICHEYIRYLRKAHYNKQGTCTLSEDLRMVPCPYFSDSWVFPVTSRSGEKNCYICKFDPNKK